MELPSEYALYQWFADWVTFRILDMTPMTVPIYTGLQFDGNYRATLSTRSNMNVSQTLLLRNDGVNEYVVPQSQWSYFNSFTILLSPQAFDATNTYTVQYNGSVIHPDPLVTVLVEIRQGETASDVLLAAWEPLETYNTAIKTIINNLGSQTAYPFFQMRMSVSNVSDTRFIRVNSLLCKGIPVNWWGNKFINHSIDPGPI